METNGHQGGLELEVMSESRRDLSDPPKDVPICFPSGTWPLVGVRFPCVAVVATGRTDPAEDVALLKSVPSLQPLHQVSHTGNHEDASLHFLFFLRMFCFLILFQWCCECQ